jgi:hypothetical protein
MRTWDGIWPTGKGGENAVEGRFALDAVAADSCVTYATPVGEIATAKGSPGSDTGTAPRIGCPTPVRGDTVAGGVHEFTFPVVAATALWSGAPTSLHALARPERAIIETIADHSTRVRLALASICTSLSLGITDVMSF